MRQPRSRQLALAALLGMTLAAGPVLAQPADNPGRGQGPEHAPGQQRQPAETHQRGQVPQERGRAAGEAERQRDRNYRQEWEGCGEGRRDGQRIDEREVRRIFEQHRDWVRVDDRDSLPPGVRMNLERGKPLPPGIARNFDERLLGELPRYDGYRWRRVGPDAVLVDAANDVIHAVLRDILD